MGMMTGSCRVALSTPELRQMPRSRLPIAILLMLCVEFGLPLLSLSRSILTDMLIEGYIGETRIVSVKASSELVIELK